MCSSKEKICIEKSREAKIANATARLVSLRSAKIPFDSPICGFSMGIKWEDKIRDKVKQAIFMPFALILYLSLVIVTPLMFLLHLWEIHFKKQEINKEIIILGASSPRLEVPQVKTLKSLWQLHGLDQRKCTTDEILALLRDWIDVLYGNEISKDLHLERRVQEIATRHVKSNILNNDGENKAVHFRFVSPVDSLIRKLSEELPRYE